MKKALEFHDELRDAIEYRKDFLETELLPKLKEMFVNYHSSFKSVVNLLLNKALIKEDPYKHDQKISEISIPPSTQIMENEKAVQLGTRLSFYDTQLEHITHYYVFSVDHINTERINLLRKFTNHIHWKMVAETSQNPTTRALASLLVKIRNGNDQLSISIINTSINQLATLQKLIDDALKEVEIYQKEAYKFRVRDRVIISSGIYKYASENSSQETLSVIRKKFNETMVEEKFIPEYINEILEEEFSTEYDELRQDLLYKLTANLQKKEKKEEKKVKIKPPSLNMLLNAALTVCSASSQLQSLAEKINENVSVISDIKTTQLIRILSKIFKINNTKNILFEIEYIDDLTGSRKVEKIDKIDFIKKIQKLQAELSAKKLKAEVTALTTSAGRESYLLDFIDKANTRLKIFTYQAGGIDKFIKKSTESSSSAGQLKGFVIENNAVKNIIIKSKQQAQEYKNLKEEYRQFRELGIEEEKEQ